MATATDTQSLTATQKELVAVGASVGAGCHPCVSHHLKAGADAGLEGEQLLAALTTAEHITAEADVLMGNHARSKLGPAIATPAELPPLEAALAALGAALGANDASAIDLQMRTAHDFGATHAQLEQAIETAKNVQANASRIHVREARRVLESITPPTAAAETDEKSEGGCGCKSDNETGSADSSLHGEGATPRAMIDHCRDMFDRMFGTPQASAETTQPEAPRKGCSEIQEV